MGLKVYKISEFDHTAERKQFESVKAFLYEKYGDSNQPCFLIGNYNIEGVELDAMIASQSGFCILEFKNWGGNIIASENGSWTADGNIIEGGAANKTPFTQIRLNKSRATKGLGRLLGVSPSSVCASIIFYEDSNIDISLLSKTVLKWLSVMDNAHLSDLNKRLRDHLFEPDFVASIPQKLGIANFEEGLSDDKNGIANEVYEPEAATIMYEELERTLEKIPDYMAVYTGFGRVLQK